MGRAGAEACAEAGRAARRGPGRVLGAGVGGRAVGAPVPGPPRPCGSRACGRGEQDGAAEPADWQPGSLGGAAGLCKQTDDNYSSQPAAEGGGLPGCQGDASRSLSPRPSSAACRPAGSAGTRVTLLPRQGGPEGFCRRPGHPATVLAGFGSDPGALPNAGADILQGMIKHLSLKGCGLALMKKMVCIPTGQRLGC